MAIDPVTLGILLKGASQGIKTGSRLMQPKFGNSAYGRQLSYAKKHGNLSPGAEKTILNRVGNVAGRQADVTANRYMGGLINRGIQGSVSARRGLREAEADVRRTVSDTAKGIYVDEERAKSNAKMQYARGLDQDKAQRRQAWTGLLTAGLDTAGGLAGAEAQTQADTRQSYMDMATKYGADNIQKINAPGDDQGRYTRYGAKAGAMPIERKQAIEEYAQKSNIKDASGVTGAFSALQSGDIDAKSFRKQLKTGNNPLTDEQIDNLFAFLANL